MLAIYLVRKFGLRPSRAFKSRINRDQQLDMHEAMGDIPVQSIVRVDPTSSGRYASYPVTTSYPRTGAHEAPHEHDYPQEHEYPHEYAQDHLQEYPEYLGDGAQDHYNAQYYPDGHGTYSGSRH